MSDTQHSIRVSPGVPVTAASARADDTIATDQNYAGLTIKQKARGRYTNPSQYSVIDGGEQYFLHDTGEVDVVIPAGLNPVKGDPLYIATADQTLSKTAGTGKLPVGKVGAVGPERGLRSDMMTVRFDARKDL